MTGARIAELEAMLKRAPHDMATAVKLAIELRWNAAALLAAARKGLEKADD